MLLIGLLIAGFSLPLALASPRALALCLTFGAVFLIAILYAGGATSIIMTMGVLTAGLIAGAVLRAVLGWSDQAEDRQLRKDLPRELPQRYR